MSAFRDLDKKNNPHKYIEIPENKEKNKATKKAKGAFKNWIKRKGYFFYSNQRYMNKELVVNWLVVFLPIIAIILVAVVPSSLGMDFDSNTLNTNDPDGVVNGIATIGFVVLITLVIMIIGFTLKLKWRRQRNKGTYWPDYMTIDKASKLEIKKAKQQAKLKKLQEKIDLETK